MQPKVLFPGVVQPNWRAVGEKKVSRGALPAEYYGHGHLEIVVGARKLLIRIQDSNCVWGTGQALSIFNFATRASAQSRGFPWRTILMSNRNRFLSLWRDEQGQDIAEYAVMLAVILVIVVGTIRLIGSNANNVFSSVASSIK